MAEINSGETRSVETMLASTLESVDKAEEIVLQVAEEAGFEEEDCHKIGMAVRESMVNAVVHGNRYHAQKQVHLSIRSAQYQLKVVIRDEGEGFDFGSLPDPLAQENLLRQSGRGILLIQAFVDEFLVRRAEPRGTEVVLVKYLDRK